MQRVEITNFAAAYVFLALVIALFTPLADPARLMVASQLARVERGKIPPEKFDFAALKFNGARWGGAALTELSRRKDSTVIAERAAHALTLRKRDESPRPTLAQIAERITIYPEGRTLPASFYEAAAKLTGRDRPICFRTTTAKCFARFLKLTPDSEEAVLFVDIIDASIFRHDANGQWREVAQLQSSAFCPGVRDALMRGEFTFETHTAPDIVVGDKRLTLAAPWHGC